eukprot:4924704-Karenia_brevis.AAC.1
MSRVARKRGTSAASSRASSASDKTRRIAADEDEELISAQGSELDMDDTRDYDYVSKEELEDALRRQQQAVFGKLDE